MQKKNNIKISLSLFACPSDIGSYYVFFNEEWIDSIHIDLMDGKCVPLMGCAFDDIERISRLYNLPIDVHLMVENQYEIIDRLSGIKNVRNIIITIVNNSIDQNMCMLKKIRSQKQRAFISIWPDSSLADISEYKKFIDGALIMTSYAGRSKSVFLEDSYSRLNSVLNIIGEDYYYIADGGIRSTNLNNFPSILNEVVIGRAFFDSEERGLIERARKVY